MRGGPGREAAGGGGRGVRGQAGFLVLAVMLLRRIEWPGASAAARRRTWTGSSGGLVDPAVMEEQTSAAEDGDSSPVPSSWLPRRRGIGSHAGDRINSGEASADELEQQRAFLPASGTGERVARSP